MITSASAKLIHSLQYDSVAQLKSQLSRADLRPIAAQFELANASFYRHGGPGVAKVPPFVRALSELEQDHWAAQGKVIAQPGAGADYKMWALAKRYLDRGHTPTAAAAPKKATKKVRFADQLEQQAPSGSERRARLQMSTHERHFYFVEAPKIAKETGVNPMTLTYALPEPKAAPVAPKRRFWR